MVQWILGYRVGPLADSFVSGGGNLFYSPFSRISDHRVLPMVERDSWKPAEGREQGEERSVCLRLHGSGSHRWGREIFGVAAAVAVGGPGAYSGCGRPLSLA